MAEHTPKRPGDSSTPHDATLLPGSESQQSEPHDATLVRDIGPSPRLLPRAAVAVEEICVAGYDILEELGRGGMGVVYKARCRALNRMVALKMVLSGVHAGETDLARFRSEAETVAQLQHPNIVQIYEIGEQSGRPYLALELVAGGTLSKVIAGTPQPVRPTAYLIELLARAIHFAHQRGVIHRDLKPGNVLLAVPLDGGSSVSDPDGAQVATLYGIPKVTDFGLAKRMEDDAQHTRSGDILGTPSYMAPEQASGKAAAAGPATDVYALGAILYDMLTGRPPFKGATTFETIQQVLHEDPVPPGRLRPRLPKDLERICLKCLAKDPRRRYDSALELAADLRRHLNGESVHARSATPVERIWRWVRRNPVPASLLLAITFGAAFGFWHLSDLSKSLVQSTAIEGAVQQSETMNEVNRYYSRVASHLSGAGVRGVHDWETHPGERTMPPPATLTIDLGQQISERSESGMQVRLYSEYPFKNRANRPPLDDFEREALSQLRKDPSKPYYRFVEYEGRQVLRFATARVMESGCVNCHNKHPDRNTTGPTWKEGEVRGVLEIIRPVDRDQERIHRGLQSTVLIVSGSGFGLLGLSVFLIYLGNRRRRLPHVANPLSVAPAPAPAPVTEGTEGNAAKSDRTPVVAPVATPSAPPETPRDSPATEIVPLASEELEVVVVWRAARAIGTLTPVRMVIPADGTLRLSLNETEVPVELRVEGAEEVVSDVGHSPQVEILAQTGHAITVRVRSSTATDALYTLVTELLVTRPREQG